jgi:hypothetical protein
MLVKWGLGGERPVYSPLPSDYSIDGQQDSQGAGPEDMQGDYRIGVGLLSYATNVRPDVQDAYSLLSGRMGVATATDLAAMVHVSSFLHTS